MFEFDQNHNSRHGQWNDLKPFEVYLTDFVFVLHDDESARCPVHVTE
jgi:hypothetical protein